MLDVVLELGDERVDAVELALADAGSWLKRTRAALAVEVAVEVEQVGLEQRVVGVLVERRPAAEVDGARVDDAVGPLVPAGVDAVGGHADGVRHLDVGGREAEQPAPLVADHDHAAHLVRAAEHAWPPARRRRRPGPGGWPCC